MQLELTFLGTSSMFPTKDRNHASVLLRYEGNYSLFDCGEGTQRQMRVAGISPYKINNIFLSHWHGDHSLGLGGIIQSMSATNRVEKLDIYGPEETERRVGYIMSTYIFRKTFGVNAKEAICAKETTIMKGDNFSVSAINLKHNVPCLGFKFIENSRRKINLEYLEKFGLKQDKVLGDLQKGKDIVWKGKKITAERGTIEVPGRTIAYLTDFTMEKKAENFCKGADVLVCESTYSKEDKKKLEDRQHLSSVEAAELAKRSGVKRLILTHFSQRYNKVDELLKEAKEIFPETVAAKDFMVTRL